MIAIGLVLAFIEGDQSGNQQAQMSICLFLFCRFYMVELKLSYRSSHLKRYKVKQVRKIYKKKKARNLTVYLALPFGQCATKQDTKLDGPCPLGPKEIYRLLVSPGKTYTLLTDHLITGLPLRSVPAQEKWF